VPRWLWQCRRLDSQKLGRSCQRCRARARDSTGTKAMGTTARASAPGVVSSCIRLGWSMATLSLRLSIFGSTDPPSVALVVKFHVFVTQVSQGLYIYINVICDIGREYDIRIKLLGYPLSTKSKPSAELGDYLNFFLGSGYSYCWHTNPASNGKIEPPIRNELRVTNGCLPTTAILHKQVTCCT
jgi:hypothetical protein